MLEDQLRDQVGCWGSLPVDQNAGELPPPRHPYRAVVRGLARILVIGEAALAADFITRLIFKHLENKSWQPKRQ